MRIALVGCRQVGTWGVGGEGDRPWARDDQPLVEAFAARGAEVATPACAQTQRSGTSCHGWTFMVGFVGRRRGMDALEVGWRSGDDLEGDGSG